MRAGIIDIGTNTVLCLEASIEKEHIDIISDVRFHYRAGRRLDEHGSISTGYKISLRRALLMAVDKLKDCSEIKIVATEVLRRPNDGRIFASELAAEVGSDIEIIDPQREARLSFLGVIQGMGYPDGAMLVIDVGGGSSEIAAGSGRELEKWLGIGMGAVMINENVGYEKSLAEYMRYAEKVIDDSNFGELLNLEAARAVFVGGSAVALAAILNEQRVFKPEELQGFELRYDILNLILEGLSLMSLDKRRFIMSFDPERADIIVGGGAIISAFMNKFGFESVKISINGLRHGLLLELYSGFKA